MSSSSGDNMRLSDGLIQPPFIMDKGGGPAFAQISLPTENGYLAVLRIHMTKGSKNTRDSSYYIPNVSYWLCLWI